MQPRKHFAAVLVVGIFSLITAIQTIAGEVEQININTATAEELMQLNGVGPKYADRIIAYREKYGPFKTPDELMQVSGIGQKTFEKNREIITVDVPQNN